MTEAEKANRTKTQSLSLRLDPKTRFILEFLSRVRGQSITMVVERAIKEVADKTAIGPQYDSRGNEISQLTWVDFWDPDEGVRSLKLLTCAEYETTFEEDEIRRFTLDHWPFFYTKSDGGKVNRSYTSILWPQLNTYLQVWRSTRKGDFWAAGNQMSEDIRKANVAPPKWPLSAFDDEVPF